MYLQHTFKYKLYIISLEKSRWNIVFYITYSKMIKLIVWPGLVRLMLYILYSVHIITHSMLDPEWIHWSFKDVLLFFNFKIISIPGFSIIPTALLKVTKAIF